MKHLTEDLEVDVLILGSGAAGLTAAITAKSRGLSVAIVEKAAVYGGTTALSGGVLWIPGNRVSAEASRPDNRADIEAFLRHETGPYFDAEKVQCFLDQGPKMVDFLQAQTSMQFVPTLYPDYHPDSPGGAQGGAQLQRAILAKPFDIRALGEEMGRLKPPLKTITFMGMMFNSSNADLKHFFQVTRSLSSALFVGKRLLKHLFELLIYKRAVQVTSGNALAARLAKSAFDVGIPIYTDTKANSLIEHEGRVVGARLRSPAGERTINAKQAVVLACGGFPHDLKRRLSAYRHLQNGGQHVSPTPESNTGDGIALATELGAECAQRLQEPAAWIPVSRVPGQQSAFDAEDYGVFPHLLDRYKPGIIAVLKNGKRFTNESNSYHDVCVAMRDACQALGETETSAWLIADHRALKKYGLGFVKPAPLPNGKYVANGYLKKGDSLAALAAACGIDAQAFEHTIARYNLSAAKGQDPEYGRGGNAFNRYLADPNHGPNPCVAPIVDAPFYAVKIEMGDLGTYDGLTTTAAGQVQKPNGDIIPGLYAVGNDRQSMMGGNYPAAGITHGPNMTFAFVAAHHIADHLLL